jgi:hypothetical protein
LSVRLYPVPGHLQPALRVHTQIPIQHTYKPMHGMGLVPCCGMCEVWVEVLSWVWLSWFCLHTSFCFCHRAVPAQQRLAGGYLRSPIRHRCHGRLSFLSLVLTEPGR